MFIYQNITQISLAFLEIPEKFFMNRSNTQRILAMDSQCRIFLKILQKLQCSNCQLHLCSHRCRQKRISIRAPKARCNGRAAGCREGCRRRLWNSWRHTEPHTGTQGHTQAHTGTHGHTGAHRNTVPRNSKVAPVGRWPLNRKHGTCVRVFVNL